MSLHSTKTFFREKLEGYKEQGFKYFEISPPPDCCASCAEKANRKIAMEGATDENIPPFHDECRCGVLPLWENDEAGALARQMKRYASGEFPKKRCPFCKGWIAGNAAVCTRCGKVVTGSPRD